MRTSLPVTMAVPTTRSRSPSRYWRIISAMISPLVPTSGAGMSMFGPMSFFSLYMKRRVMRLQLLPAVLARIDLDPALAAAEGDLGDGGLPGHLRGQRLEQVERHLAVVADAALVRAAGLVVLDAVGLEALRLAGHQLVHAAVGEAKVAAADVHVRSEQRLAVEDDLPVGQPLQPVGVPDGGHRQLAEGLGAPRGEGDAGGPSAWR